MTPSKNTLEAANPANETSAPSSTSVAKPDISRMRSDAVSLEVPVKVHGSRVTDAGLGAAPQTEPFEEKTTTMIVFPQGGVLKMSTTVATGQMMVVTNLKSGHDAICRVIKVRAFAKGQSYVEIEFTHRQPGYWGVYFPSDGPEAASSPAPAAPTVSVEVKVDKAPEKLAPEASRAPLPAAAPSVGRSNTQPVRPESAFAPIGSREEVQPAASATSRRGTPGSGRSTDRTGQVAEAARKSLLDELPMAPPVAPTASVSMTDLQGDSQAAHSVSFAGAGVPGEIADPPPLEAPKSAEASAAPFGRFAASASLGGGHATREAFGSSLSGGTLGISAPSADSSKNKGSNWMMIAAGVVGLLLVGTGATYYMHMPPFAAKSATPAPAAASVAPPAEANAQPSRAATSPSAAPVPAAQTNVASAPIAASAPAITARVTESESAKPAKAAAPVPAAASAPANQRPAAKVPDIFGSLNAHPTSRTHSNASAEADAAPAVEGAASGESSELPVIGSSPAVAPAAPQQQEQQGPVRIRVGGAIKPPQLISSVLPVYPAMARETGIEGDVVVDTTVDATGNVTSMKVISGPPVLRQAALDALRRWKYEPSKLDGQPVPVQMTVTIKFHHQ